MNSVYEPGSRIMSKNRLRNSTESKMGQKHVECTKCTALASPRAQDARPGRPAGGAPNVPAARPCRAPRAFTCVPRAPVRPRRAACRAQRKPAQLSPTPARAPRARPTPLRAPYAPARARAYCAQLCSPCCIATQAYPKLTIQFLLQYKPVAH